MKRSLSRRRLVFGAAALLSVLAVSVLLGPRVVRAFTLPNNIIYFDPISVPVDHTVHVHVVNEFATAPISFRPFLKPTTPAAGSSVVGATVVLNQGEGFDQEFSFAGFTPPAGATRVPIVCTILVAGTGLPTDWSGRVASSVEIIDDVTGKEIAILGGRHIIRGTGGGPLTPCLSCN